MSTLEDARAALGGMEEKHGDGWCICTSSTLPAEVESSLRRLIVEHENLIREMHQRELHHFEVEKSITEALARYDAHEDVRAVLVAALTPSTPYPKGEEK